MEGVAWCEAADDKLSFCLINDCIRQDKRNLNPGLLVAWGFLFAVDGATTEIWKDKAW